MTNQQILEKAIQKAIDGGFDPESYFKTLHIDVSAIVDNPLQYGLIFNHDFCRALWAERTFYEPQEPETFGRLKTEGWQYHLQNMVIADDPIKYLGDNI